MSRFNCVYVYKQHVSEAHHIPKWPKTKGYIPDINHIYIYKGITFHSFFRSLTAIWVMNHSTGVTEVTYELKYEFQKAFKGTFEIDLFAAIFAFCSIFSNYYMICRFGARISLCILRFSGIVDHIYSLGFSVLEYFMANRLHTLLVELGSG